MIVGMKYLALAVALYPCSFALQAQAPATAANPFLGSWKRNFEKSGAPVPAGVTSIREYQDRGGLMLHTIVTTTPNGGSFTFTAAKYDGQEYPVYVARTLGEFLSTGTKPARTVAFIRKDAHTLEWTDRQNGRISSTGVNQVSEDGKTMTETVKQFDAQGKQTSSSVLVFDKQ
jgi:hypothetical protein